MKSARDTHLKSSALTSMSAPTLFWSARGTQTLFCVLVEEVT